MYVIIVNHRREVHRVPDAAVAGHEEVEGNRDDVVGDEDLHDRNSYISTNKCLQSLIKTGILYSRSLVYVCKSWLRMAEPRQSQNTTTNNNNDNNNTKKLKGIV